MLLLVITKVHKCQKTVCVLPAKVDFSYYLSNSTIVTHTTLIRFQLVGLIKGPLNPALRKIKYGDK